MKRKQQSGLADGLLQRARKPSYKSSGLPRVRPCAACGEERTIVARGLCDKCRKKEERMEAGMNFQASGNKQTKESGTKLLAKLLELMGKAKLLRSNRERVLQEFMPFLGYSPETQRTLIREMTGPGVEDTESPFAKARHTPPDADDDYGVRVTVQRGRTDTSDCLSIENKEGANEPEDETEGE
jgi:hypothetical protein